MAKYSFKFRLDATNPSNEFITDNLVYLNVNNVTIKQMVKLINLALDNPEKVNNPKSNFEEFNPEKKENE